MSPPLNHQNNYKLSRSNSTGQAVAAKSVDSIVHNLSKEPYPAPLAPPVSGANTTGSAILDTYLQFITENSLGMGMMSTEQAAAAVHAAKLAQFKAMGLDKASQQHFLEKMQQQMGVASDLMIKQQQQQQRSDEIRRSDAEVLSSQREGEKAEGNKEEGGESSGGEDDEYSDEEGEAETVKAE